MKEHCPVAAAREAKRDSVREFGAVEEKGGHAVPPRILSRIEFVRKSDRTRLARRLQDISSAAVVQMIVAEQIPTDDEIAVHGGAKHKLMGWIGHSRHLRAKMVSVESHHEQEPSMSEITTIGLDLGKSVFRVHGVNEAGGEVTRKRLRRAQMLTFFAGLLPCLVGMEAWATAYYWARELRALGHEVRLMPPQYVKDVKAYLKRNKNDAADAAAICEAVRRPSMRFVPVKTREQQAALLMHHGRELLVRQRTMLANAARADIWRSLASSRRKVCINWLG
jgi:hypothetical protein